MGRKSVLTSRLLVAWCQEGMVMQITKIREGRKEGAGGRTEKG